MISTGQAQDVQVPIPIKSSTCSEAFRPPVPRIPSTYSEGNRLVIPKLTVQAVGA